MINEEESKIGKSLRAAMTNQFGDMASKMSGTEFLSSANSMLKGIQEDEELEEKWSEKYKKSIDCNNPKGFSQKAHCQGKKKKGEQKEMTGSGSSGAFSAPLFSVNKKDLEEIGKEIYKENFEAPKLTMFSDEAPKKIETKESKKKENDVIKRTFKKSDVDKLIGTKKMKTPIGKTTSMLPIMGESEDMPDEVKKIEATEATGSGSAGSYLTPAAWAKSMNKKDWRGKSKTQIPGGKFVQVKKKCKKFPYCNQGDVKALKLTNENEDLLEVIKNVSRKQGISENMIKNIIFYEYQKHKLNK